MYQMLSIARGHIMTRNLIYKVINKPKNTRRFNFQEFYKSLNVCGRIKRMNETDASTINKKMVTYLLLQHPRPQILQHNAAI